MSTAASLARALQPSIKWLDGELRGMAEKCALCERPDGGVIFANETRLDAGLIDRARCQRLGCPMRREARTGALTVTINAPRPEGFST